MIPIFVDTNIPMYSYGGEHPYRDPCRAALTLLANEEGTAVTSAEVLQELFHSYLVRGRPDVARQVTLKFMAVVPDILPIIREDILKVAELSLQYPHLPCRDLVHVAVMLRNGISEVLSADTHFDSVERIKRIDPLNFARFT